ncbi:DNA polymerase Y family protein [Anaerococcus tetradius]|uniref:DNA polymerase IV n=1 Tax=Anaerococcus tetradius ATCC 35098 TaxID=525255 RepID=C2CIN5_9FIRM|nr:DNA polymerase IV [Anaerococcus tetradius]EEI82535.1 DNA polymerase IV [Anaerococcus tetradius ATCC 35098]
MKRVILHSDMNACYASIEQKLNPKLKNIPMAVAGNPKNRNGIILAKSQEAKEAGVKTGEAIWQALGKCPNLTLVSPQYDQYLKHSKLARKIYYDYTNQVEPFGLDECFLDVTGSTHLFGSGEEIANEIRQRMKEELGITVSVGVSFCKIFAKLGSDMKKPDAVTIIREDNFRKKVWPLPVGEMVGIGRATERKLNRIGIFTLGELAKADLDLIRNLLGVNGLYLWEYANGLDIRPVHDRDHQEPIKTIGNSSTCRKDLLTNREVFNVLQELAFSVSRRLREARLEACGVEIFVRNNELQSYNYQSPIKLASQSSIVLARSGFDLFKEKYKWDFPVRAVGIRAIKLRKEGGGSQIDVFCDYKKQEKEENCDKAIYKIRKKYGREAISFLGLTRDIKLPKEMNEIITLPMNHYNF